MMPATSEDRWIGAVVGGGYRVEAWIGEGGCGAVYRCRHQNIGKLAAMKVLLPEVRDEEMMTRFLREAKAASGIRNPHIIDVTDFGTLPDGSPYCLMEYLDGQSLAALTKRHEPVPLERILPIALQLVDGLAAAHREGIIHRDLKPENVFLIARDSNQDFVKILDFGMAKVPVAREASNPTLPGAIFGTPHYMSPEQARGEVVDERTDVYALGVILYELVSGRLPFDGDNCLAILELHKTASPQPLREMVPDVSPEFEAIVLKCLSKGPEERYASMGDLATALERVRSGLTVPVRVRAPGGTLRVLSPRITPREPSPAGLLRHGLPRHGLLRWVLGAVIVTFVLGGLVVVGAVLFPFVQASRVGTAADATRPVGAVALVTPETNVPSAPSALSDRAIGPATSRPVLGTSDVLGVPSASPATVPPMASQAPPPPAASSGSRPGGSAAPSGSRSAGSTGAPRSSSATPERVQSPPARRAQPKDRCWGPDAKGRPTYNPECLK